MPLKLKSLLIAVGAVVFIVGLVYMSGYMYVRHKLLHFVSVQRIDIIIYSPDLLEIKYRGSKLTLYYRWYLFGLLALQIRSRAVLLASVLEYRAWWKGHNETPYSIYPYLKRDCTFRIFIRWKISNTPNSCFLFEIICQAVLIVFMDVDKKYK